MREAFEAVAEFLAHHGGLDEYDAVLKYMQHMGWALGENHVARWRGLFATLRAELSDVGRATNYVNVFEKLFQLYVHIPLAMCREVFASDLVFHIIVERFATAFKNYDADVFKLESDVLCHTENIYALCALARDKLYNGDESSPLGVFLRDFRDLFDQQEPKTAWETFCDRHRLPESVFRRDLKRVLWRIEDQVFGITQIEQVFASEDSKPTQKRVIVPRKILESKFSGSKSEWRDLASVVSVKGLSTETPAQVERRRESLVGGQGRRQGEDMNDVVGETPPGPDYEERVWSARLPIATPGGDTDSSGDDEDNTAIDAAVRQEKPTQKTPGKGSTTKAPQQRSERPRTVSEPEPTPRPSDSEANPPRRQQQQQQRAAAAKRAREQDVEEIDDDDDNTVGDSPRTNNDDGDFLDPAEEFSPPPKRRKGRKFWSDEEVEALVKGVKKYGGQWLAIKQAHKEVLRNRTNVDIKDKYRNLVKSKRIPPIRHAD